jgi:hypothetical protein
MHASPQQELRLGLQSPQRPTSGREEGIMLALKLVRLIESDSERLAQGLIKRLEREPKCVNLSVVPREELQQRAYEVYHNLASWLLDMTEYDILTTYRPLGVRRAEQGVPFADLYWALVVTKENLCDFLRDQAMSEAQVELFGVLEAHRQIDRFFDRAIYFAAQGYASVKHRAYAIA